jgi:glycosyltransferase involved in cell wall biosynthesis
MRIFALCLVKDECDVISQTLTAAARWSDAIYVFDNGSTDGTWEAVRELARTEPRVVPDRQDSTPYDPSLRRLLFDAHRGAAEDGDWWCILDADEFYIDDLRTFVASVPLPFEEVWAASFEYYFTEKDVERYERNPSAYGPDVPVERKLRYYLNNWSEPRFFRHRCDLIWKEGAAWPEVVGPACAVRIRLKHYQYRSPEQIAKRLRTRLDGMRRGRFRHEMLPSWRQAVPSFRSVDFAESDLRYATQSWRDRVVDSALLVEDAPGREYVVDEDALPPIPHPRPPLVAWVRRRARPLKRLAQTARRRGQAES